MSIIHPTSEHIARYVVKHGEAEEINAGKPYNRGTVMYSTTLSLPQDDFSVKPIYSYGGDITIHLTDEHGMLFRNPSQLHLSTNLVTKVQEEERRVFSSTEYGLTGVPQFFTLFHEDKPISVIHPEVYHEDLNMFVKEWQVDIYRTFLEEVYRHLV